MNIFTESMPSEWLNSIFKYFIFFSFIGIFNLAFVVICWMIGFSVLKSILVCLAFTIGLIIVCAYGQNVYLAAIARKFDNENIKAFARQAAVVKCAFCEEENFIPIRLDEEEPKFMCEHCNKQNALFVEIFAAQTAVPLEIQHNSLLRYTDDREEQYAAALEKHRREMDQDTNNDTES